MANDKPKSDQRFRSFAERYLVTRSHLFSKEDDQLAQDTWACIQDARRAYKMIYYVSFTKFDDRDIDSPFDGQ